MTEFIAAIAPPGDQSQATIVDGGNLNIPDSKGLSQTDFSVSLNNNGRSKILFLDLHASPGKYSQATILQVQIKLQNVLVYVSIHDVGRRHGVHG